jgi:hypothetical protein
VPLAPQGFDRRAAYGRGQYMQRHGHNLPEYRRLRGVYGGYRQGAAAPAGYNPADFAKWTNWRQRYGQFEQYLPPFGGGGAVRPGQVGPGRGGPGAVSPGQIGRGGYGPRAVSPYQMGEGGATGFVPPGNITINVGGGDAAGGQSSQRPRQRQRQALQSQRRPVQRRYGQQQGMGRGYQSPRPRARQAATDYTPQPPSTTSGYAPRTSGMYGGRPSTMRDQWSKRASVTKPWGGRRAVQRYYEPQAY